MPALAVGALGAGVAVVAWPSSADIAVSAPVVSSPSVSALIADGDRINRADRADRGTVRPALAPTAAPSASASAPAPSAPAASAKAATADDRDALEAATVAIDKAAKKAELVVTGTKYVTTELNVRTKAKEKAKVVETLDTGSKVKVTGTVEDGFRLIENDGDSGWVKNSYLSAKKPEVSGVTMKSCGLGSGMESGLTSDAILVHRTVCANYPEVTSFGGRGGGGFHASGRAVDCMISNSTVGWRLARWLRAHASELGVSEVIYEQKIWTVQRGGEGWRPMSDRGSASANHYDHVHVSVYGNAATG